MLYIKNNTIIKDSSAIVIIKDGVQYVNPTEEMLLENGWEKYTKPAPTPKLKPSEYETMSKAVSFMMPQIKEQLVNLDDQEALEVKELYDTWSSKIGTQVKAGERLWYNDKLYKVLQQHTVLEIYPPGVDTASLYAIIEKSHAGTLEDPIPYEQMMLLEKDKYYEQYGVIYRCTQTILNGYPYDLKDMPTIVTPIE